MKKIILFSLIALLAGSTFAQNIKSLPVGSVAPMIDSKMIDVSGKEASIKSAMGKNGVLVMFSCNTCPYVIKNQERTKAIAAYALSNNTGVIVLNSNEAQRENADSYKAMQSYAKEQGYNFSYTVDENAKIADAFGATRTPEVFLIDASGKIVYKGAIDDNPSEADNVKKEFLKEAIAENSAGKTITAKESKSVGCSIKRKS